MVGVFLEFNDPADDDFAEDGNRASDGAVKQKTGGGAFEQQNHEPGEKDIIQLHQRPLIVENQFMAYQQQCEPAASMGDTTQLATISSISPTRPPLRFERQRRNRTVSVVDSGQGCGVSNKKCSLE